MGGAHAGDSGSNGAGGRSYQGNQWGGNPFANSSNPFKGTVFDFSSFFSNAPTAEELVQEAKADLRLDIELIVAKLVILALSFLLSAPATGLYLYTIISIGQGIWKRLNFLSLVLLVPFVMLALIFTPGGDSHHWDNCPDSVCLRGRLRHIECVSPCENDSYPKEELGSS